MKTRTKTTWILGWAMALIGLAVGAAWQSIKAPEAQSTPSLATGTTIDGHGVRMTLVPEWTVQPEGARTALYALELEATDAATRRDPVALVVALDTSGSMDGNKIANGRRALERLLDHLTPGDEVTVLTFDTEARLVLDGHQVGVDDPIYVNTVRGLEVGGGTCMSCGLELAQTALRDAPASFQKRLLVISDGHPTVGDTMPHNLNQMVDRLVGEDVVTSVLGLGRAVNEKLLADVANRGSGIYQFVRNSVVLDDALAAETNDFKAAVARDLAVALQVPPGVVVEEGSVRRVRNLRPGTPRRFLLRLQLPEGGWTGDLLTARAQWAGGDRQLALSSSVGRGLGGARNWAVTVEDVRAKNSAAMTASLEEASKGNPEEGERQLTRQIEGLPALMAKAPDWVRKDLGAEQREMIRLRKIVQVEAPTSVEVRGNFLYQQFRFNNISNGNPAQITPVFLQDSNEELE